MKKLLYVVILTLAINFLALAGGVGWLHQSGRLGREKAMAIKEILFPKDTEQQPTTAPSDAPTSQPGLRLEELLAQQTGRSASDQVDFIQKAFDQNMRLLDRRQMELVSLQGQVELAKQQMARDRAALDQREKALNDREQQASRLASDKGFQDSLALYNTMAAKQVKTIFMGMDDRTMTSYLQTMQPRTAARIIKEFKAPEESERIQKVLKQMSPAIQASIKE